MDVIEINEKNLDSVLKLCGKEIDSNGYIIESKTKKRVNCPYSKKKIHSSSFSVMPGSFTFINNEPYCFTEHMAKYNLY